MNRPELAWTQGLQQVGPDEMPWAKLNGMLTIGTADYYVEAYAVHDVPWHNGETLQEAVGDPDWVDSTHFDALSDIVQGAMQTIEIDGHQYVLLITPCGI